MGAERSPQAAECWPPRGQGAGWVAGSPACSVIVEGLDGARVVVAVAGELDNSADAALRAPLSRVLATRPERLIIDLSQVSFLSAAGVSVLIRARQAAARQGIAVQVRAPRRRMVARSLEITGLDGLFEIVAPAADTDTSASPGGATHPGVPQPRGGDRDSGRVVTVPGSSVGADQDEQHDEYAHLVAPQRRFAELASDDPQRPRLREALIRGYLPVAEHIARRFAGRGEPVEDLIQVATVGLVNAVDRFDPARGSHFLAFAVPTITGELRRYFRDHGWSTRVPRRLKDLNLTIRGALAELSQQLGRSPRPSEIADRLGVPTSRVLEALHAAEAYRSSSLDEMLSRPATTAAVNDCLGNGDDRMDLVEDREALRPLLAQLPPRERTILRLRFFHQLTQTQIAEQIGVSQMHISRLLRQTLALLQERLTRDTR